jgi:ABC-type multidrug transport system ATPase subunit
VHEPAVLLLDEPFTGLDELSAERLSTGLGRLGAGGRTIVLITHDPRRAVELTSRALILQRGRIVARPGTETTYEVDSLRASLARAARETERESAA